MFSSLFSLIPVSLSFIITSRNRYNFRYGLTVGAKVATKMGDSATASRYLSVASDIQNTILTHYNGQYIYESTNRQKDAG